MVSNHESSGAFKAGMLVSCSLFHRKTDHCAPVPTSVTRVSLLKIGQRLLLRGFDIVLLARFPTQTSATEMLGRWEGRSAAFSRDDLCGWDGSQSVENVLLRAWLVGVTGAVARRRTNRKRCRRPFGDFEVTVQWTMDSVEATTCQIEKRAKPTLASIPGPHRHRIYDRTQWSAVTDNWQLICYEIWRSGDEEAALDKSNVLVADRRTSPIFSRPLVDF